MYIFSSHFAKFISVMGSHADRYKEVAGLTIIDR